MRGSLANNFITGNARAGQFHFNLSGGQDTVADYQDGIDKFVLGAGVKTVDVFVAPNGFAALDLYDAAASTPHTYVLLQGIPTSQIDNGDFLFA